LCFFEPTWSFYLKFNLSKTIKTLKKLIGGLTPKNTITTDQLNGLVTDLGHVLLDTAQKLQGKGKIKNVAFIFIVFLFAPDFTLLYESLAILN
jgi:hypothetical protein